ncbi:MAG: hypothetical protein RLZZ224_471 [Verrucomicrobiota bacterium]|jgi:hypothetical protein
MEITITSPAALFPAISLIFLAYTNRFLHLSSLVRKLHSDWLYGHEPSLRAQIINIRRRIELIRWCQATGVISLIGCLASILSLLLDHQTSGVILFTLSAASMAVSLLLSLWEVLASNGALNIYLNEMSEPRETAPPHDTTS